MSNLLSETFTNAFAKVRLSSDRVLKRFIRLINSIMNFAVRVLQLFLVTLLYFSAVKTTYFPFFFELAVVPFMEVYNKSLCRPREVLVEIQQEYPDDTEHIFIPSCVVLTRCNVLLFCCSFRVKKDIPEKRENSQCEPCCSTCSERRRRFFVQDPETCQCSCKHSEADCRSRQLELNERTCRCDKPRR
uniref:Vascular endothelial growth factor Ab n=1 Tax=Sinocyclocheilus grahami TaxID=75366 RepID=A0A672RW23_SINGR